MSNERILSRFGYEIPSSTQMDGEEKTLIICHGFGSSKDSPMVQALRAELPKRKIGTISFDFPAHGESPVDGSLLRIPHCLENLSAVEAHVRSLAPKSQLFYFGSSFGAYILLLYLASYPHKGTKSFLRSAAVNMYGILKDWFRSGDLQWTNAPSEQICRMDSFYGREFFITSSFMKDLESNDLFRLYPKDVGSLFMIHGSKDSTASPQDAARFAALSGAKLQLIKDAEHRLMEAGEMEIVLQTLSRFLDAT